MFPDKPEVSFQRQMLIEGVRDLKQEAEPSGTCHN